MPIFVYLCPSQECSEQFDKDKPAEEQTNIDAYTFEIFYSERNANSERDWCPCPKCGKKAKKIPSVSARMAHNWSKWNAV